jgi:hypothetical protein
MHEKQGQELVLIVSFILFYFRHYPTQAVMGALWGLTQGQANRWILRLMPLLKEALDRELVLPEQHTANLKHVLKQCADDKLLPDATERPVRRPPKSRETEGLLQWPQETPHPQERRDHRRTEGGVSVADGAGQAVGQALGRAVGRGEIQLN